MEQTRIASSAPQGGIHGTRGAAADKGAEAQDDGFAQLLSLLGGEAGLPDAAAVAAMQESAVQAPDAPPAESLAAHLAALMQTVAGEGAQVPAASLGREMQRDTLVGQTALMDGAAESAAPQGAARGAVPRGGLDTVGHAGVRGALRAAAMGTAESVQSHKVSTTGPETASLTAGAATVERQGMAQALHAAHAVQMQAQAAQTEDGRAEAPASIQGLAAAVGTEARSAARPGDALATPEARHAPEPADTVAPTAEAAQAQGDGGAQEPLAERVAYWVHQKTQNAELTLDRDGRPVDVTVSITGDEAHIAFRSDHAEARHLLDAGTAQLREMLHGEGLRLAGVTVGTGGGGAQPRDGGDGERGRGRSGGRAATVQVAGQAGAGRMGGVGERSVDIFV